MTKIFYLSILITLVLSFGVHAFDFNHAHYHAAFEQGLDVMMHTNKEEWLFLLLVVLISAGAFIFETEEKEALLSTPSNRFIFESVTLLEPNRLALRRGILHPKICG